MELSLEYSHCKLTDVSNCYPSIYSHAIAWAIHGRKEAKAKKFNDKMLGNQLDRLIRSSREGQTNGIPQASLLSYILAELVLGYCDTQINRKLKRYKNINILRYRDDYRIFGYSDSDCGHALKVISEELIPFGMKLGVAKTTEEKNLISGAIKKDKMRALKLQTKQKTLQKELLIIHDFCLENPGAGALKFLLSEFIKSLENDHRGKRLERENSTVLIAILMDIGAISPNIFPAVATAASLILNRLSISSKQELYSLILERTKRIPNNGYLEIWLQRIALPNKLEFLSAEKMCNLLYSDNNSLWSFDWVQDEIMKADLKKYSVVDKIEIETLKPYIERPEFDAFWKEYY